MRIENVIIACHKKDVFLLRSCVASIRYWYPSIQIYLLKDTSRGRFSTREMETAFDVHVLHTEKKYSGFGMAKFDAYFSNLKRFLLLDADTVFLGRVIDELEKFDDDFIVTGVGEDTMNWVINKDYINIEKVKEIDPAYTYPGYAINTGHMVVTSGLFNESDLSGLIHNVNGSLKSKHPDIFPHADQLLLNYVLRKKQLNKEISVRYHSFWIWPFTVEANEIELSSIKDKTGIPFILHWAGLKPVDFVKYKRYDILEFYNKFYYSNVGAGRMKQLRRHIYKKSIVKLKLIKYKLYGLDYEK